MHKREGERMAVELRAQVWAKTDGHCWYCGKKMNPWNDFTIEHMDPSSRGGCDDLGNLVPACQSCNSRKHRKTVEEYRAYLHEKKIVRFWGEQNTRVIVEVMEEEEDEFTPTVEEYQEIIRACFEMGACLESGIAMTLIALLGYGFEWSQEDEAQQCEGSFDITTLSQQTGLGSLTTLSHINRLLAHGFLVMSWRTAPYESHDFTLYTGAILSCGRGLRKRELDDNTDDQVGTPF
jgi:HNH endonuclease